MPSRRRTPRWFRVAVAVLAALLSAASAAEQVPGGPVALPAAGPAPRWFEAIDVNGFVSASWGRNLNDPASGANELRTFDAENGSITLDVASLVVRKEAGDAGETGFRLDLLAGSSFPGVTAADGLFRDPETGEAGDFDLLQAFVTWVAPVGSGLRLDVGKFLTPAGFEAVDGFEEWNAHATRSFQFTLSEPTTHTGLRAGYAFSDALSAELLVVNGWDDARDRNGRKTFGASIAFAPGAGWSLSTTLLHGPEQEGNDRDDRSLLVASGAWEPPGRFGAAACLELGQEQGFGEGGESARWWSLAGYVTWDATPAFSLALRVEHFDDLDGARSGTAQKLLGLTLTPAVALGGGFVVRADLRVDFSDREVFEDEEGLFTRKGQPTILLNALYAF
jgi:hypothetical protein